MSELTGAALDLAVAVKLGFSLFPDAKTGRWAHSEHPIQTKHLPGYSWDLNAMAEVERHLKRQQQHQYTTLLKAAAQDTTVDTTWDIVTASATQRARAFPETSLKKFHISC